MLQLLAQILGTSGPLTTTTTTPPNSPCLTPLSNRVNKFPFIGGSLTKQRSLSFLQSLSLVEEHTGDFSGQIRLGTRVNMCRRG